METSETPEVIIAGASSEENIIWSAILDGVYECVVEHTGDNVGELSILDRNSQTVIYREPVIISYNAIFGPDIGDVAEWQNICVSVIDGTNPYVE